MTGSTTQLLLPINLRSTPEVNQQLQHQQQEGWSELKPSMNDALTAAGNAVRRHWRVLTVRRPRSSWTFQCRLQQVQIVLHFNRSDWSLQLTVHHVSLCPNSIIAILLKIGNKTRYLTSLRLYFCSQLVGDLVSDQVDLTEFGYYYSTCNNTQQCSGECSTVQK